MVLGGVRREDEPFSDLGLVSRAARRRAISRWRAARRSGESHGCANNYEADSKDRKDPGHPYVPLLESRHSLRSLQTAHQALSNLLADISRQVKADVGF